MGQNHQLSAEERAAIKLAAHQRVEAVWACLDVLCPDLTPQAQKELARKVLDLSRGRSRNRLGFRSPGSGDKHSLGEHAVY